MKAEAKIELGKQSKDTWNYGGTHPVLLAECTEYIEEATHVNNDSTPITIFLFFNEVTELLAGQVTNNTIPTTHANLI
jgi:hypothetical protein